MGELELQIFADRLKKLRTELNMTQAEFVSELGITASALSAYEQNQKNPSIGVAKKIAEKYNVSIDWLCGLSNNRACGNKIETYRDLFSYLLLLSETDGNFYLQEDKPFGCKIVFCDFSIDVFFIELRKMKKLLNDGTIDIEVFNFWLEKFINNPNYSCKLKERKTDFFKTEKESSTSNTDTKN